MDMEMDQLAPSELNCHKPLIWLMVYTCLSNPMVDIYDEIGHGLLLYQHSE